jgi:hypothetical protein
VKHRCTRNNEEGIQRNAIVSFLQRPVVRFRQHLAAKRILHGIKPC